MADDNYDNLGRRDLVTVLRQIATNPTHRRGAMIDGHKVLGTAEEYPVGSADAQANYSSAHWIPDYDLERELGRSYIVKPEHLLAKYLDKQYQVHPENPAELRNRVFFYEKAAASGIASLVLDISQTLMMSFIGMPADQIKASQENVAMYEAVLEAEKEFGNNPAVLREAVDKCLGKDSDGKRIESFCYIWAVPRK